MLTPADMAGNGGEGVKDLSPLDRYIHTGSGDSNFNCLAQSQVNNAEVVEMFWGPEARKQYDAGLREKTED